MGGQGVDHRLGPGRFNMPGAFGVKYQSDDIGAGLGTCGCIVRIGQPADFNQCLEFRVPGFRIAVSHRFSMTG
jgi:hypothetical protein